MAEIVIKNVRKDFGDFTAVRESSFTIGIDEVDVMIAKLAEMPSWPIYKIKLGTANDLEIITALREMTDQDIRVGHLLEYRNGAPNGSPKVGP